MGRIFRFCGRNLTTIITCLWLLGSFSCGSNVATPDTGDRFIVYSGDVILDMETGLVWKLGPDENSTWEEALSWVSELDGSWRMPLVSELVEILDAGVTTETWGCFDNTGWEVWGLKTEDSDDGVCVCFRPTDVYNVQILTNMGMEMIINIGQRVWAVIPAGSFGKPPTYIPQLDPI